MNVKVASNRFIVSSVAKSAAFYQQINANVSELNKLGAWLLAHAERLQAFRQIEKLEIVAEVLSNLPFQEYKLKGQYYLAWCRYRNGQDTRLDFELVVEKSDAFRDKGLISLAGLEVARKDYTTAMKHYQEAIKWAKSPATLITAVRSIAIYKSDNGNHKEALGDLQALYPIARYAESKAYYDYLNSLAVELCEAKQIEAASEVSRIVLASPMAFAYPEWRETSNDIALRGYKSRSSVPVIQSFSEPEKIQPEKIQNVLKLPERTPTPVSSESSKPAKLFNYLDWKKKMGKDNGEEQNTDDMSDTDIFMEIMHLSSQETITRKQLQQILDAVKKITSKKN